MKILESAFRFLLGLVIVVCPPIAEHVSLFLGTVALLLYMVAAAIAYNLLAGMMPGWLALILGLVIALAVVFPFVYLSARVGKLS